MAWSNAKCPLPSVQSTPALPFPVAPAGRWCCVSYHLLWFPQHIFICRLAVWIISPKHQLPNLRMRWAFHLATSFLKGCSECRVIPWLVASSFKIQILMTQTPERNEKDPGVAIAFLNPCHQTLFVNTGSLQTAFHTFRCGRAKSDFISTGLHSDFGLLPGAWVVMIYGF